MKKHKISIKPIAAEDMQACIDYVCDNLNNSTAALRLLDKIEHMYDLLEDNPFMGKEHITEGGHTYRYVLIKSYMIFYKVQDNSVVICRFLYGASDYDNQLENT